MIIRSIHNEANFFHLFPNEANFHLFHNKANFHLFHTYKIREFYASNSCVIKSSFLIL